MEEFGSRLRRLRLAAEMTPNELSNRVGVTEGAIRQMESGQTKIASFPVGVRLAEVLGVEPHYLAFGDAKSGAAAKPIDRFADLEQRVARLEKAQLSLSKTPATGPKSRR